jgi:uncharacterized protein YodC (DUF2158 family)
MSFKIGDVVYLKSGSPAMTVRETGNVDGQSLVACTWFEGNKKFEGEYQEEQLTKQDPKTFPPASAIKMG